MTMNRKNYFILIPGSSDSSSEETRPSGCESRPKSNEEIRPRPRKQYSNKRFESIHSCFKPVNELLIIES
ncbi:unnamed protein product, partial [Brachionus calyciflorus]